MNSIHYFDVLNSKYKVARELGFEPRTLGLEDRCSIQLSYSRTLIKHTKMLKYGLAYTSKLDKFASSKTSFFLRST